MKRLTIITNNADIACIDFFDCGLVLDIKATFNGVLSLENGTEIIIRKYGVGRVRCEVCSAAEALVAKGYLKLDEEFNTSEEKENEPDSA